MKPPLLEGEDLLSQAFLGADVAAPDHRSNAKGKFALIRFMSVLWTTADLASWRLRFAFLVAMRCRRVACARHLSGSSDLEPSGDCFLSSCCARWASA